MKIHLLILAILPLLQAERIRVACVGDSITFGSGVEGREKNCYPAVLGGFLGERYEVGNFGVSGATLLKKGDKPYWKEKAFTEAADFKPDVVVIKLGTNDTKPQNWKSKADFETDYLGMIRHFKGLASKPRVFVAIPVAVVKSSFGITEEGIAEQIPILRKVAKAEGCPVIDLHAVVATADLFVKDGVHPNAAGAKKIAETVLAAITDKK